METISIIMPCYKYAHFLPEAMESVANQSVKPNEVLIINDGSPDNTSEVARELIEKYPELNIKLIEQPNGGLSSARNTGVKNATSKYCMSFDADDILRPDCIKEHLKLADENTIVTCGLMAFGDQCYTARPEQADLKTLLQRNVIYSNSLFPTKKMLEIGGFDESMRKGVEDWECWIRMAEAGCQFKTSDYIGLLWRRHGNTMSDTMANPNWHDNIAYFRKKHAHLYKLFDL